ncbi:MAG: glycosyltransferase family 4 protein [Coleofasciculaceae cyanobacterium]
MLTIAVIFTNYGPYHFSRLIAFQKLCHQLKWNTLGIELARSQIEYAWKTQLENFDCRLVTVIQNQPLEEVPLILLSNKIFGVLSQINPDVVAICGYEPMMLSALVWSCWNRKPAILLSASKEDDAPRIGWRETVKHWIIKGYKAALVGGQPQKRYLTKLGMNVDSVFLGYNVVGNDNFHPDKIKSLVVPNQKPYFLAINRFIPKKNLLGLLSSYAIYHQIVGSDAWDLVICGDGILRPQIEQKIAELDLKDVVHLPGFLQQNELLPYLAHAKCFLHASIQEQWGLVVNEAMAAGLPVIISNRCGCFEDLIIEGVNGFGFDPENSQQLTNLMLKMSSGEIDLKKMSQAALEHIQNFSPEYFAQGLKQAVEFAINNYSKTN